MSNTDTKMREIMRYRYGKTDRQKVERQWD
jgi:hypothetical protein